MEIPNEIIEEVTKRLIEVYNPITMYLFGPYLWELPTEEPELDILIVTDESQEKRHKRGKDGYVALWGMNTSKYLSVFTKAEFEDRLADHTSLIYKIAHDGKVLYSRK